MGDSDISQLVRERIENAISQSGGILLGGRRCKKKIYVTDKNGKKVKRCVKYTNLDNKYTRTGKKPKKTKRTCAKKGAGKTGKTRCLQYTNTEKQRKKMLGGLKRYYEIYRQLKDENPNATVKELRTWAKENYRVGV